MTAVGDLDDRALLRAFKEQQARLRAADDVLEGAGWLGGEYTTAKATADREHARLEVLALEMRRRREVYEAVRAVFAAEH